MAIKTSGQLSFTTDIVGEFGGSAPHSLSEYKRGGSLVPNSTANNSIPTTNSDIQFSDFYGAQDTIFATLPSANLQEIDITSTYAQSQFGWSAGTPLVITFPSGIWVWSDDTSKAAVRIRNLGVPITINNYAKIIGRGGNGSGETSTNRYYSAQSGGPAIIADSPNLTINNYSGAYIAGGGGGGGAGYGSGGGGGAGGGTGGTVHSDEGGSYAGGAGGALGQSGSRGVGLDNRGGFGGGAGGEGGSNLDRGKDDNYEGAGGGGGRILPGSGGTGANGGGGAGGSGGNAGTSVSGNNGGGGGGWGASGGSGGNTSGGSGGRAVTWNSTKGSVSNSGTIYGAYT